MNKKISILILVSVMSIIPVSLFAYTSTTVTDGAGFAALKDNIHNGEYNDVTIDADFETESCFYKNIGSKSGDGTKIYFTGNSHVITATNSSTDNVAVINFDTKETKPITFSIENLTINVGDGFRYAILIDNKKNTSKQVNLILKNVTIIMNHTDFYGANKKYCAAIVNNSGTVTFEGNCKIVTDEYCWAAVDNDNKYQETKFIVNSGANLDIVDNRSENKKTTEPIIKFNKTKQDIEITFTISSVSFAEDYKFVSETDFFGYALKDQHIHGGWTYGSEENTIYAICTNPDCPLEDSKAYISVFAPGKLKLSVATDPEDAEEGAVTWSSDNTGVATVDSDGVVTAVSAGSVNIKATATGNNSVSDSINLTVE